MPAATPPTPITTIWQLKPWWCQPWSILLTGVAVVLLSWLWLKIWWLTAMTAAGVLGWWGLYLVLVPRAWRDANAIHSASP